MPSWCWGAHLRSACSAPAASLDRFEDLPHVLSPTTPGLQALAHSGSRTPCSASLGEVPLLAMLSMTVIRLPGCGRLAAGRPNRRCLAPPPPPPLTARWLLAVPRAAAAASTAAVAVYEVRHATDTVAAPSCALLEATVNAAPRIPAAVASCLLPPAAACLPQVCLAPTRSRLGCHSTPLFAYSLQHAITLHQNTTPNVCRPRACPWWMLS